MKSRLVFALIIGAIIQSPSVIVSATSSAADVLPGIIICWLVNAVLYAVPAFVVVMLLKLLAPAE